MACTYIGAMLLGARISFWTNNYTKQPHLFHARDVLQAISLIFAFDDTKEMIEGPSRNLVGYLIGGETIVKLAAGGVHLTAVYSQHTHG